MADYISSAAFSSYAGVSTSSHGTEITAAITAASRAVDGFCGRQFSGNTSSVTTKVYRADWAWRIEVDDIGTTASLVVKTDEADSGTYGTTWTVTTDFTLDPPNGSLNGITWPYTQLRATGTRLFPTSGQRSRVQVAGCFGWPAIPDAIVQATTILALDIYKLKDSPFGVAGSSDFGVLRVRDNRMAMQLLQPYTKNAILT